MAVVLRCNNYDIIDLGVMTPCARILERARAEQADLIGLSGLITPSLEEMTHVAAEMEREGFTIPLLIGGATTSKVHTAVKMAPVYRHPVIHVTDASRAVEVVSNLLSETRRQDYEARIDAEYTDLRKHHEQRHPSRNVHTLEAARRHKHPTDWTRYTPPTPAAPGLHVLRDYDLATLINFIDWTPFFQTWELKGAYPRILEDTHVGTEARALLQDARALLTRMTEEKRVRAHAVFGLFPANTVGDDDIEIYTDDTRTDVRAVVHGLRQQMIKLPGRPNWCLADFIAPKESGVPDYIGAFAVTAGDGVDAWAEHFVHEQDDYNEIMLKALADRLAEAFAEHLHQRVRREFWGYAPDEDLDNAALIAEHYRGIRPAPGYPACPDHTEKGTLFDVLEVTRHIGIRLTESYAMWPAAAVSGYYFAHPESSYFGVGRIQHDQVEDYARRKGIALPEMEKWLAPLLG